MSDPSATSAMGKGRDPDGTGLDAARSYPPGSRLRQALDLARRSRGTAEEAAPATPEPEPEPAPDIEQHPDPAAETPTMATPEPEAVPQLKSVPVEQPGGDPPEITAPTPEPAPAVTEPERPGSPRRRGLGRGLEALIPTNGTSGFEDATWETSAQGWVQTDDGSLQWRPVVTTLHRLDRWEVGTYLGLVSGQSVARATRTGGDETAAARVRAVKNMVDAAVARGAHGVIGVNLEHAMAGDEVIVTATGTGVTLVNRG